MIYLKKGQPLLENPSMVVYDQTGYYNDGDSVVCAPVFAPEEPACRYEAKFIAYGGIVYSITDPDKLLEEITKLDPSNLFGKDSQEIATDKMINQITTVQESVPTTTSPVVEQQPVPTATPEIVASQTPEPAAITTPAAEPVLSAQATSSPVTEIIAPPVATNTPETIADILSDPSSSATTTNP